MRNIITKSEKETLRFGKEFAKRLKGGEVIGLIGELGAGKTVFAKGLAQGLGIKKHITSPTFVLMRIYKGRKYLVHIDAYRVKKAQEILDIGAGEYFGRPDAVVVIEWAEKIKKILPRDRIWIKFGLRRKENERVIDFNGFSFSQE